MLCIQTSVLLAVLLSGLSRSSAGELRFETSFAEGQRRAKAENRLLLVDFWRDGCIWCQRLEANTFTDQDVKALLAGFVLVKAKNTESPAEVQRFGVDGYPTMVIVDPEGNAIDVHSGYMTPDELCSWVSSEKDYYGRIIACKDRLGKDPGDLATAIVLGRLYAGVGKYDLAGKIFDDVLRLDPESRQPESAEAHLEKGMILRKRYEYTKAVEAMGRAKVIALRLAAAPPSSPAAPKKPAAPAEGKDAFGKDAPSPTPPPVPPAGAGARPPSTPPADVLESALYEIAFTFQTASRIPALIAALEDYDAKVAAGAFKPEPRRHARVLLQLGYARRKAEQADAARAAFARCDEVYPRTPEARECREELASGR